MHEQLGQEHSSYERINYKHNQNDIVGACHRQLNFPWLQVFVLENWLRERHLINIWMMDQEIQDEQEMNPVSQSY